MNWQQLRHQSLALRRGAYVGQPRTRGRSVQNFKCQGGHRARECPSRRQDRRSGNASPSD
ncbi:hypothetical protein T05_10245 [Trichinella murrelli]|uniref:CCHC-type domain-containing protein n=1 Tax=Trichinella murrelli TaxID=144512 RepID=A0A0V0T966_9BILA|nr:hypothetical protein T05_10245 [Trichinella murrelli]